MEGVLWRGLYGGVLGRDFWINGLEFRCIWFLITTKRMFSRPKKVSTTPKCVSV